jgi:hypothetical protein
MRRFLKYLLAIITLFMLIFFYVKHTESGKKYAYDMLSLYASYTLDTKIKILDLNLTQYPHIKADILLYNQYKIILDGFTKDKHINFYYQLVSDCFSSDMCTFDDKIDIKGKISGHKNHILITGSGNTLDGNATYSLVKEKKQFKDVSIILHDINSTKLFTLLGEKTIFKTKIDAHLTFDHTENDSSIFDISLSSKEIQLHITQGKYLEDKETAQANYTLHIPQVSLLGKNLLSNYRGSLNVSGKLKYKDKALTVFGISKDFGGPLYFNYEHNKTHVLLQNVAANTLMKTFNIDPFIDANISGEGIYDLTTKQMDFNAKLGTVKLLTSALKNEVFHTNTFDIHFKNDTFHANLKLMNKQTHLMLIDTTFKDMSALSTNIDFKTPKQESKGKLTFNSNVKNPSEKNYSIHFDGAYQTVPLKINTNITMKDKKVFFNTHAKLISSDINISDGFYDIDTNTSKAFYTFSTKDLSTLAPIIGKYLGTFYSRGSLDYQDTLQIRGLTNSFGGMVDFLYKNNMLYVDLENVSLTRFMQLFPYPQMLQAQVNGNINYDYTKKQLLIRTDLNNTKFLSSVVVDTIFNKSGINLLKEVFTQSTLFAIYQYNILAGDLILKNRKSHFYVKNTQLNTKKDTVNAHFDLRMQGQEFSGKVYGSLQNPKVNLNLEKLIRYQMDKQLDAVIGKGNRELMESMPMGGAAKDVATDMGTGFLEMFF